MIGNAIKEKKKLLNLRLKMRLVTLDKVVLDMLQLYQGYIDKTICQRATLKQKIWYNNNLQKEKDKKWITLT